MSDNRKKSIKQNTFIVKSKFPEKHQYIKTIDTLVQYFTDHINKTDGRERLELFNEIWVLKEDFIKAINVDGILKSQKD